MSNKIMDHLTQYRKSDFKKLSWNEYAKLLGGLQKQVSVYLDTPRP